MHLNMRTLERLALLATSCLALYLLLLGPWRADVPGQGAAYCQGGMPPDGPSDAFVQPGMTEAPQATMANSRLSEIGQVIEHKDARGLIYRFSLGTFPSGRSAVINLMRTHGGSLRSGDMHNCTQFDVAISGRVRLRLKDLRTGKEITNSYDGSYDFIAIPPRCIYDLCHGPPCRVPHIFEYVDDGIMLEWWDCDFRAWHYKPYRDLIASALSLGT